MEQKKGEWNKLPMHVYIFVLICCVNVNHFIIIWPMVDPTEKKTFELGSLLFLDSWDFFGMLLEPPDKYIFITDEQPEQVMFILVNNDNNEKDVYNYFHRFFIIAGTSI